MVSLLSAINIDKLSIGESLLILVIGMLVILSVLSILIGLLYAIRYMVEAIEKIPKKESKAKGDAQPAPIISEDENDEEVVAAITAAITCIMEGEKGDDVIAPFRIKKIKHIR